MTTGNCTACGRRFARQPRDPGSPEVCYLCRSARGPDWWALAGENDLPLSEREKEAALSLASGGCDDLDDFLASTRSRRLAMLRVAVGILETLEGPK